MKLDKLISEGEKLIQDNGEEAYNKKALDERGQKWVQKSISYLQGNYPESVLTRDFITESKKIDMNFNTMVGILKGLKDVEEEIGSLNE